MNAREGKGKYSSYQDNIMTPSDYIGTEDTYTVTEMSLRSYT